MEILSESFHREIVKTINENLNTSLKKIEREYAIRSRYLSKTNACKYANIDPKTLDKWLAKGLPISKIDGCYRIDTLDIDSFLVKHRI